MTDDVYIIDSNDSFNDIYDLLSNKSIIKTDPTIRLIGFDCEMISENTYTKSFYQYLKDNPQVRPYNNIIVCKILLHTDSLCVLIDLVKMTAVPNKLVDILKNESWIKTGVGISNDMLILSENYSLGQFNGHIEMKNIGVLCGIEEPNLLEMYKLLSHDISMTKFKTQLSDWSKDFTLEQIKYAKNDAYMSYIIGKKMFNIICPVLKNTFMHDIQSYDDIIVSKPIALKMSQTDQINYVGKLQEYAQKNEIGLPKYIELTKGPNSFDCRCIFNEERCIDKGKNKKEAKQNAAHLMCQIMNLTH